MVHERRDAPGWRIGGVLLLLLLACAGPESARAPHGRVLAMNCGVIFTRNRGSVLPFSVAAPVL